MAESVLFANGFIPKWSRMLLDLVFIFIFPFDALIAHYIRVLIFGYTKAPALNLLPPLPKKYKREENSSSFHV